MRPAEKLKEIEETLRIHNELAKSQSEWLIARVKRLTSVIETFISAVERDELTAHQVDVARKALEEVKEALAKIAEMKK